MSSFISNFRQEAGALALVLLVLAGCELGLRASIRRVSIDVRHIEQIPRIVSDLSAAPPPTVLFLGNSLTRAGVDVDSLGLGKAHVALLYPDDTAIADWLYLYKRRVRAAGAQPDLVLVPFSGDQLSDAAPVHTDRLGSLGGLGLLPEACAHDARDLGGRVSYVLGALSSAYANRDRVRTEVLRAVIPGYRQSAETLNKSLRAGAAASSGRALLHYTRLERLLESSKGTRTRIAFVRMPVPSPGPIDPGLELVLREHGAPLLDLRRVTGVTDAAYLDGYHLAPHGAALFSRELSRRLLGVPGFDIIWRALRR
jgi:hypothetical protein